LWLLTFTLNLGLIIFQSLYTFTLPWFECFFWRPITPRFDGYIWVFVIFGLIIFQNLYALSLTGFEFINKKSLYTLTWWFIWVFIFFLTQLIYIIWMGGIFPKIKIKMPHNFFSWYPCKKKDINIQNNSLKTNPNPSRYYYKLCNLISNFNTSPRYHVSKILI